MNLDKIKNSKILDDVKMSSPNGKNINIGIHIDCIGAAHEAEHGYRETIADSEMSLHAFIQYMLEFEGAFLASEYYVTAPDLCAVMTKENSSFKVICKKDITLQELVVENKPLKVSFRINKLNEAVINDRMELLMEKGVKQLDDIELAWLGMPIGTDANSVIDELAGYPAIQAILGDSETGIEASPKEHWILKLNSALRLIRLLISPFR